MKILYFGAQKSGKSSLAEARVKAISDQTPYYVATYDSGFDDSEMALRLEKHRLTRQNDFITIEESRNLLHVIKEGETYLIDCVSMWLFNRLNEEEALLIGELEKLCSLEANIVFVLNDVGSGIIPADPLSRRYVDLSGIIGQTLARLCDEVIEVKLGLEIRLK